MPEKRSHQLDERPQGDTGVKGGFLKTLSQKTGASPKKLMIVAVALFILFCIGISATLFFWKAQPEKPEEAKTETAPLDPDLQAVLFGQPEAFESLFSLAPFRVPLKDDMGEWEFRVTIWLEAASPEVKKEIQGREEEVREVLTPLLRARRPSALQGVDNKIVLKTELIAAVNKLLKTGKIRNLYFTEFFVI